MDVRTPWCSGLSAGGMKPSPAVITITRTSPSKRIEFYFSRPSSLHSSTFFPLPVFNSDGKRPKTYSTQRFPLTITSSSFLQSRSKRRKKDGDKKSTKPQEKSNGEVTECVPLSEEASISVRTLYQNGDPLGRRESGKSVFRWISQGMRSVAADFASAEIMGEFVELRQRLGLGTGPGQSSANGNGDRTGGLAFVIHAQPYLYAISMPKGLEAICFKACAHYSTLFDHFSDSSEIRFRTTRGSPFSLNGTPPNPGSFSRNSLGQRNCEALMLLRKTGLHKKNPLVAVVATLFGEAHDLFWLELNYNVDRSEAEVDGLVGEERFDKSQLKAITLGLNRRQPLLVIQGPLGTGKTCVITGLVSLAVKKGERVLVSGPTMQL